MYRFNQLYFVFLVLDPPSTVFAPNGAPIYRIERGGEVTFHGPKQLVVYPLLDLRQEPYEQDLHWYLNCVEDIIIQTLKEYDIEGVRDKINTGVYRKVFVVIDFIHPLFHYALFLKFECDFSEISSGVWVNEKKIAAVGISCSRWITTHGE